MKTFTKKYQLWIWNNKIDSEEAYKPVEFDSLIGCMTSPEYNNQCYVTKVVSINILEADEVKTPTELLVNQNDSSKLFPQADVRPEPTENSEESEESEEEKRARIYANGPIGNISQG